MKLSHTKFFQLESRELTVETEQKILQHTTTTTLFICDIDTKDDFWGCRKSTKRVCGHNVRNTPYVSVSTTRLTSSIEVIEMGAIVSQYLWIFVSADSQEKNRAQRKTE